MKVRAAAPGPVTVLTRPWPSYAGVRALLFLSVMLSSLPSAAKRYTWLLVLVRVYVPSLALVDCM